MHCMQAHNPLDIREDIAELKKDINSKNLMVGSYLYYRKLLKICPPTHLFVHYFETKVGRGHLLKCSISLMHTPLLQFYM